MFFQDFESHLVFMPIPTKQKEKKKTFDILQDKHKLDSNIASQIYRPGRKARTPKIASGPSTNLTLDTSCLHTRANGPKLPRQNPDNFKAFLRL